MPPEREDRDAALVLDIRLAAQDALEFGEGLDEAAFMTSRLHQAAIIRCLELIGEAANGLTKDFRDRNPDVPWSQIIGMRHRLIHGYSTIALEVVWRVLREDVPDLLVRLQAG
jgi:uncharacterized protein with HEPN domain